MEISTLWNRIDQLERLVLAQSRDIDDLKKLICKDEDSPQLATPPPSTISPAPTRIRINTCNAQIATNQVNQIDLLDKTYPVIDLRSLVRADQARQRIEAEKLRAQQANRPDPLPRPDPMSQYLASPMLATMAKNKSSQVVASHRTANHANRNSYSNMSSPIHPTNAVPPTANWPGNSGFNNNNNNSTGNNNNNINENENENDNNISSNDIHMDQDNDGFDTSKCSSAKTNSSTMSYNTISSNVNTTGPPRCSAPLDPLVNSATNQIIFPAPKDVGKDIRSTLSSRPFSSKINSTTRPNYLSSQEHIDSTNQYQIFAGDDDQGFYEDCMFAKRPRQRLNQTDRPTCKVKAFQYCPQQETKETQETHISHHQIECPLSLLDEQLLFSPEEMTLMPIGQEEKVQPGTENAVMITFTREGHEIIQNKISSLDIQSTRSGTLKIPFLDNETQVTSSDLASSLSKKLSSTPFHNVAF